ncbi:MAG: L-rhamnose mutarotase [Planctomycetes bacterium]|nr:L-rhamnose mutarotase [Planctomycetota bacterium]
MKRSVLLACVAAAAYGCGSAPPPVPVHGPTNPAAPTPDGPRYHASVVELLPEREPQYRALHADVWPEVLARIRASNIRDYRIYRVELGGRIYLFSTFAYVGQDFDQDMAAMAADPTTRDRWWPITDACQRRIPGTPDGQQWLPLEQVMHIP